MRHQTRLSMAIVLCFVASAVVSVGLVEAFFPLVRKSNVANCCPRSLATSSPLSRSSVCTGSSTSLYMIGDLLNGLLGGLSGGSDGANVGKEPTTILDISAKAVKPGPLKFYLQIFLVGGQNKPSQGSWVLNQNDERQTLEMFYADGTGMFAIDVKEYGIQVKRYGQKPSLQYMLQESVLLGGLLDELEILAFGVEDENIAPEKRLLQFSDDQTDVLSKVRETLPARAAPAKDSSS